MRTIILASQSPRRRQLLTKMGIAFTTIPSDFEEHLDDQRTPEAVATELALGKALAVAKQHPEAIVIGSDTIVTIDGRQLGKPTDATHAHEMLRTLSGRANAVTTGLAVVCLETKLQLTGADTCLVHFKPYNAQAVADYVATGDALDKAGAYGIQSGAMVLVDHFEGRLDTIIGLPTLLLAQFLQSAGIPAEPLELTPPLPAGL